MMTEKMRSGRGALTEETESFYHNELMTKAISLCFVYVYMPQVFWTWILTSQTQLSPCQDSK